MSTSSAAHLSAIGLMQLRHRVAEQRTLATTWQAWIDQNFSGYLWPPYADYHAEFWEWVWAIQPGASSPPFVAIWARGFAKSTSTEVACALVAGAGKRNYGLYICETQERADDHVSNVAGLLESPAFGRHYPGAASRKLNKFGNSKGWRRNRVRTASGFTLDAIGLDSAARGAKLDEERPDFLIFDDIDGLLDSPGTIARKIKIITQSLLPSRAPHAAVLVVQNLIHEDGVVSQLADGRAEFLADRIVSGPHPAIRDLTIEKRDGKPVIVGGESTWPAITIADLQTELSDIGETAFRREKQHEVGTVEGGIFGHIEYRRCAWADLPALERCEVWVDPAVTDTEQSDAHGIQADALGADGLVYRLYSWEQRTSPEDAMRRAILKAVELKADVLGVETDQGGDTWKSVFSRVWDRLVADGDIPKATKPPGFRQEKAGSYGSKSYRAGMMVVDYEHGQIVHVIGTHLTLERALQRYLVRKPYDLVDAAFWSWRSLRKQTKPKAGPAGTDQPSRWKGRG